MRNQANTVFLAILAIVCLQTCTPKTEIQQESDGDFTIVKYNNKGAVADLGVGLWAWPLPVDFDGDGDMDLLVSCPDKPFNGIYFFENVSGEDFPVFAPPVRLTDAIRNIQVSHVQGEARFLIPGAELADFTRQLGADTLHLFPVDSILKDFSRNPRFNQWKMVDYDGDGDLDIVVGVDDWSDYGWDNAFDAQGNWYKGPLHGYLYLVENVDGTYKNRGRIKAGGKDIDVFGAPSPNFADFDGDGDYDIICGEFLDKLTWFENTGTRANPVYAPGRFLENDGGIIKMDLQMIVPVSVDWDGDGHTDLVVGDEDGRVALIRNTGKVKNRMPVFESPVYFQQEADNLKFGALATPVAYDWDNDGDLDLISGNSAGYFAFIENLDGGNPPTWANPVLLEAGGETIRIQAGDNGSIQGPAEAKWGYTVLSVADWDGDGLPDIIFNSIWGKIEWFKNIGEIGKPVLDKARPVKARWPNGEIPRPAWNWWYPEKDELVTQWRTCPFVIDWNEDGLMDIIMLDHEGYLAFYERIEEDGELYLLPGKRIFYGVNASGFEGPNRMSVDEPGLLRLNTREAGGSGRRKFLLTDWDGDGDLDLLINSVNISLFENIGEKDGLVQMEYKGQLSDKILAGHTTSPTLVDWNKNGIWDLLVGAEDGHFYHLSR
ncbi:MAG: VCBS repeat-containing protein [Cyclobacteriaceae bacterium]|nr:VCBS repeat-containing protein [Cyclobacteriaceae bacterium]